MRDVAEEKDKIQEENVTEETPTEENSADTETEETTESTDKNIAKEEKKEKKKKEKADKKQDALKEKIDELEDRVKRQMAEFENFRKRTEKEKTAMFETGAKSVIEKILPVVDNFERGLASVPGRGKRQRFCTRHGDDLQTAYDRAGKYGSKTDSGSGRGI